MRTFEEDLEAAVAYHGHLCTGMFMGVRMARYGLRLLNIENPFTFKDLIVFVEIDRCASDAICVVTGCTMGRKRLKLVNYGKMAATFVNMATQKAIRLSPKGYIEMPEGEDPKEFWRKFTDEELFVIRDVRVDLLPKDLPGKPQSKVRCAACGESVLDGREVEKEGALLCLACATEPYYRIIES